MGWEVILEVCLPYFYIHSLLKITELPTRILNITKYLTFGISSNLTLPFRNTAFMMSLNNQNTSKLLSNWHLTYSYSRLKKI